jgi:hypothetical protein
VPVSADSPRSVDHLSRLTSALVADPLTSPVVLDGIVSDEKLSELLALGTEYPELDFKGQLDLATNHDQVELAKDVGAMQVRGGYIVVGAKSDGTLTGELDGVNLSRFDEAMLTPMMLKWLPEPLELRARVTQRDGHKVVVVYIGRHPSGCAIFRADGIYGKPEVTVFCEGDVFWRDGTRSERMSQQGLEEVIRRRIDSVKDAWMDEQRDIRRREQIEYEAASKGSGSLGSVNLDLDQAELNAAALELVRREDDIALRHLLNEALTRARGMIDRGEIDAELNDLLDRLTCLAATFLAYKQETWFERVIDTFAHIYSMPVGKGDSTRYAYGVSIDPKEFAPRVWLAILERIFGLGALAVREENWKTVRTLTLQQPRRLDMYERNWVRYTITMAARAQHFQQHKDGRTTEVSLLMLARAVAARLECLRQDGLDADDDELITSLAEFDVLADIVAIDDSGEPDGRYFYPNFARFESQRVIPVISRLLDDATMREALFKGTDEQLALALNVIGRLASNEGMRFFGFGGWGGEIGAFIAKNSPSD